MSRVGQKEEAKETMTGPCKSDLHQGPLAIGFHNGLSSTWVSSDDAVAKCLQSLTLGPQIGCDYTFSTNDS